MKKNVYSLVLSENVVAEVDRCAYIHGTNRSNMINQILAEYVSYTTPEKRINDIFERASQLLAEHDAFGSFLRNSDSLLSLRSAIVYKYNPTVKYSVELYRDESEGIGELRVALRSRNEALLGCMHGFFDSFARTERKCIGNTDCEYGDGRFARRLVLRGKESREDPPVNRLGEIIAGYVAVFDNAMKQYFALLPDSARADAAVEAVYKKYLLSAKELI